MAQTKALVDKLLTNVSLGYAPTGHIAEQALPNLQVDENTGLIGKYTNAHLKLENTKIGGRAEAKRVDSVVLDTSDGYVVESHGLEDIVTPEDVRNIPEPFNVESDKVMGLTQLLKIRKEKTFADLVTSSSVITNGVTLSGGNLWSTYATSSPITDVKTARTAIKQACGFFPNRAIISAKLAEVLSYHPEIITNLGFNFEKAGALTYEDIKKFFKVDILHVGDVQYDSSVEGVAESMGELWDNDIVFYYAPTSPSKMQKSLGYYLTIRGEGGMKVYKSDITNPPNSTSIIVKDEYGFKLTNVACAYLIKDAM
jgi:hypothetical protein